MASPKYDACITCRQLKPLRQEHVARFVAIQKKRGVGQRVASYHLRLVWTKFSQHCLPHVESLVHRLAVRHDVRQAFSRQSLHVLIERVASVDREVQSELNVADSADSLRQDAGDVDVVDPEEWRRTRRFVHRRYDVGREEEGDAGAVRRVVVLADQVTIFNAPSGARSRVAKDRHDAFVVVRAGDHSRRVLLPVDHIHVAEYVDERVVVRLQRELRVLAVLRDPAQTHDALQRQVLIAVVEVTLDYVSVSREFVFQKRLFTNISSSADEEHDSHDRLPEKMPVRPRVA